MRSPTVSGFIPFSSSVFWNSSLKEAESVGMAGGPQGSGVDSSANIFARACCYGGLHVYGQREYHSNIKGLHSYFILE
ncbi:MAG: 2-oxoacid:acceptor oxidoreductase family protein [Candidatus Methanoperedens sp.]|nr:2-oxoacid:acceptor oxidoreductase family protein [Candidatus Methanoperedens sp.]